MLSDREKEKENRRRIERERDKNIKDVASPPFQPPSKEEITESSLPKIREFIKAAGDELYENLGYKNAFIFINTMKLRLRNERAILHVLLKCIKHKPDDLWSYAYHIMKVEDGNFYERDRIKTEG